MYWPRERFYLRGLPLLLCLGLHIFCCASGASSNGVLDDFAAEAPSPLMQGASIEYAMPDTRQQQNLTLVFVVGVSICLAIFAISYCIAYKTIMARQGEMIRLHRSRVRGIDLEEQNFDNGADEGRGGGHGGLDASLVSSLRTVQYSLGMLKEKETMKGPAEEKQEKVIIWVKECAVCLSEFEEGEEMKVLPVCGHCFHET